ncbi:hypothetical protein FHW69_001074 [Luteibacter sp. Sphag1AF]|nr:hypothetical protein [Luteibacter sp. Sphag1AF]
MHPAATFVAAGSAVLKMIAVCVHPDTGFVRT